MLTISREARIKVARHAWNVFPLEAFGFLLGRKADSTVYAALPCSKTQRWHRFEDRWTGIESNIEKARSVAKVFDMDVVGLYASTVAEDLNLEEFPIPSYIASTSMELFMLYRTFCCPSCSWAHYKYENRWLEIDEDYIVPPGKRLLNSINQKKILKEWCKVFGTVDYSNKSMDGE